ncbi:MAG: ABC transporter permease subunit [Anaerolineae bacterium]|nr:ABC transporter permease subunit [Anaerolineae bacterium]
MSSVAVGEPAERAPGRKRRGGREVFLPFLLLLPAVGLMLALYAYPFISSIYRSFLVKGQGALTLSNYVKVSELYLRDIFFSLEIAFLSTAVAAVLSILMATYLRLGSGRVVRLIGSVYRLPIFIPFVVVAQMMTTFLAPHGLLNVSLAQIGLVNLDTPPDLLNWKGLTFAFVWKQWAFMTLIVLSGFEMIDNTYIEAARSFGAKLHQVILRILVPMSRASLSVALILAFTSTVGTFTLPYMLIGGKTPTTLTVDIAHRVTYFGDYGVANALGTIAYILVVFTAVYYLRYTVRREVYEQ